MRVRVAPPAVAVFSGLFNVAVGVAEAVFMLPGVGVLVRVGRGVLVVVGFTVNVATAEGPLGAEVAEALVAPEEGIIEGEREGLLVEAGEGVAAVAEGEVLTLGVGVEVGEGETSGAMITTLVFAVIGDPPFCAVTLTVKLPVAAY